LSHDGHVRRDCTLVWQFSILAGASFVLELEPSPPPTVSLGHSKGRAVRGAVYAHHPAITPALKKNRPIPGSSGPGRVRYRSVPPRRSQKLVALFVDSILRSFDDRGGAAEQTLLNLQSVGVSVLRLRTQF